MRPLDCDSFPRKPPNNSLDLAPWNEERRHIRPLELVTHPVHLLHVGEDHFGIYPLLLDHRGHVLRCEEVGYASKLFSSYKGNFVSLQPVPRRVNLEGVVVKGIGEEVMDEGSYVDIVVLPGSALAPDQDRLHLGAERLLAGDSQLDGKTRVSGHASTL